MLVSARVNSVYFVLEISFDWTVAFGGTLLLGIPTKVRTLLLGSFSGVYPHLHLERRECPGDEIVTKFDSRMS